MEPSQSPVPRKRSRPLAQQLNDSSPLTGGSTLSAIKRRKLNSYGSSPSTPKALQALKSAIGGVLRLGRTEKHVLARDSPELEDPLAASDDGIMMSTDEFMENVTETDDHGQLKGKSQSARGMMRELPEEAENDTLPSPTPKRKGGYTRGADVLATMEAAEDELTMAKEDGQAAIPHARSKSKLKRLSSDPKTNSAKSDTISNAGQSSLEDDLELGSAGRSSGRERRKPRRYSTEVAEPRMQEPRGILPPTKKRDKRVKKSVAFEDADAIHDDLDLGFKDIPIERIASDAATTHKRKRGRPKKGESLHVGALYVNKLQGGGGLTENGPGKAPVATKMAPLKMKRATQKTQVSRELGPLAAEDPTSPDEDDTICAICKGGDSEEPNEILLCDNCDLAVHQLCYDIPVIPEGDWLCRDCYPEEEEEHLLQMETETIIEPILNIGTSNAPDIESFDSHLNILQKLLLDKLTGHRRIKLQGLDDEYQKVHLLVEQTVLAGEGNSMLLIGARGCGKTTLVETVISELSAEHRDNFHVVRLNGFIHTDDKLALREIWRQLGREMEVEDDLTSKTNNYADTLTSLLALLSHPSEITNVEADQTAKSVIFILDEFDLFATHPRQTLLYNLFDIAQARKAPIAVLGLTTKIEVVESLEKRVKSRFSHRHVHLPLPRNLPAYWEICKQGLLLDMNELVEEGLEPGLGGQDEFLLYWDSMINELYAKDSLFKTHLQTLFYRSKSVPAFFTSCILPIVNLTPRSLPLTSSSFFSVAIPSLAPPDSKLHLLQSLSELDLALLISAARLDIVLDTDTCNFAMAYDEYTSLTSKHKIQTSSTGVAALGAGAKVWGREVAMSAWERLIGCELLIPASMGGGAMGGIGGVGKEGKMWKVDVALEEIPASVDGLSSIMGRWCREI